MTNPRIEKEVPTQEPEIEAVKHEEIEQNAAPEVVPEPVAEIVDEIVSEPAAEPIVEAVAEVIPEPVKAIPQPVIIRHPAQTIPAAMPLQPAAR